MEQQDDFLEFAQEEDGPLLAPALPWKILIVDDEEEVHQITQLTLKTTRFQERPLAFFSAFSGREAIQKLEEHPDLAIVLLDVVMENDEAGLQVVKFIREQRKDPLLRILLRTGQPGIAPERQTIEQYDIDDYLPKSQLSSARLYTSVRTALRAYLQLSQLQRQRESLAILHQLAATLHTAGGLAATLERILQIASALVPNTLALLEVTSPLTDPPLDLFFYLAPPEEDAGSVGERARLLAEAIHLRDAQEQPLGSKGLFIPLGLDQALGRGWMFFEGSFDEPFEPQLLTLLASHASNVFYVAIGQAFLAARKGPESQRLRL